MSYRQDNRSLSKFKNDIKTSTRTEIDILRRWLKKEGLPEQFIISGCNSTDEYLEDRDVTTKADFFVPTIGHIEVKFSKPKLKKNFHLKVSQVKSYLKQGCSVLMVNGYDSPNPEYTFIKSEVLASNIDKAEIFNWRGMGFKPCFRLNISDFQWQKL